MGPSLRVLFALLLTAFFATTNAQNSTASPPPPPTDWTPVANTSDLAVQQVGQFAVRIYALSTGKLKLGFVDVVSGQTQPYNGGINYQLVIIVSNGPSPKNNQQYNAFVWGILGTMNWKLWTFTLG